LLSFALCFVWRDEQNLQCAPQLRVLLATATTTSLAFFDGSQELCCDQSVEVAKAEHGRFEQALLHQLPNVEALGTDRELGIANAGAPAHTQALTVTAERPLR
jgi:hypothetical protein